MCRGRPRATLGLILIIGASAAFRAGAAPVPESVYLKAGIAAFSKGNHGYSLKVFEYLTRVQPAKAVYWFNLGNVQSATGRHAQAILSYGRVVKLGSPLAPMGLLYISKSYRALSRPDYSAAVLARIRAAELPRNIESAVAEEKDQVHEALLDHGILAYRKGDFRLAYDEFDRAAGLKPGGQADLMKGMALYRLGRTDAARAQFYRVSSLSTDEMQRRDARELWNFANESGTPGDLSLRLDVSAGFIDNLYADGASEELTSNPLASVLMKGDWLFSKDEGGALSFSGWLGEDEVFGLSSERMIRAGLQGTGFFDGPAGALTLAPRMDYEFLGGTPYALRFGLSVAGERDTAPDGNFSFGIFGSISRSLSLAEDAAYVTATGIALRPWAAWDGSSTRTTASWLLSFDRSPDLSLDTGILPLAGWSTGPGLTISRKLSDQWDAEAGATYLFRSFDHPSSDGEVREDRQLTLNLRMNRTLGARTRAYAGFNFVTNGSTLGSNSVDDENYRQLSGSLGISWEMPN